MLPLYDESYERGKAPYVTLGLILVNIVVFSFVLFSRNLQGVINIYGVVPKDILEGKNIFNLFTAIFLHIDAFHLIGNMWFLWIFGDNLENNLGRGRFLAFYLLAGLFAGIFHVFGASTGQEAIPAIGASGAISGLMGGYLILYPKNRIRAFLLIIIWPFFFWVQAYIYMIIWFIYQMSYGATPTSVGYLAHIGGFIFGILLVLALRRKTQRGDYTSGKMSTVDYSTGETDYPSVSQPS